MDGQRAVAFRACAVRMLTVPCIAGLNFGHPYVKQFADF
jgi:hypothetical protein